MVKPRNKKENKQSINYEIPLSFCLAKTRENNDGIIEKGLTVEQHSVITGLVAHELCSLYPETLKKKLFPPGSDLIAAVHDVGKINPLFQKKIYKNLSKPDWSRIPDLEKANPELEKCVSYHWGVSYAALEGTAKHIKEIAGLHHGVKPDPMKTPLKNDALIGGEAWQKTREELIKTMKDFFNQDWPEIKYELNAGVLAGLTTVSDWIGSSLEVYSEDKQKLKKLVREAVEKSGFVKPQVKEGLSFSDVFSGYQPRDIQKQFIEMVDGPGTYILEELMGQGKTEAALMAAYKLLQKGAATGIYFALPTKLTSEKIYSRFSSFLDAVLEPGAPHRSLLLHGDSWLVDTQMGEEGRPGYSWFNSRKRGLLAPFAVGTIDQAMMSVMNVKHGFVRTFGLAGKVVILDEVHTYDFYTGTIMDKMIKALSSLGCTVILLSATLSAKRKEGLLSRQGDDSFPQHYPLITAHTEHGNDFSPRFIREPVSFKTRMETDRDAVLDEVRQRAFDGEYILWIENSVKEAQEIFNMLSAWGRAQGIETGLIHSRYPKDVRNEKEDYWVSLYGKEGALRRRESGKILVGTQVLEQSLDIDADFLVTNLAPTDMLLQRMGRTWRHRAIDALRPKNSRRQIVILVSSERDIVSSPDKTFGVSGLIYSSYILARTYEVWKDKTQISVPDAMRQMIDETYSEREETGNLQYLKRELETEMNKLKRFANISMSSAFATDSDHHPTRYSELPTVDVLLLNKEPEWDKKEITLLNGTVLNLSSGNSRQRKKIARQIMSSLITVSTKQAPDAVHTGELNCLKPFIYVSDNENERIRVAVVDEAGYIRGLGSRTANSKFEIFYNPLLGYKTKEIKKEE